MRAANDTRAVRVEDRMRRAWAQLLREMASEGIEAPAGADIRIREENGDLTVEAVLSDAIIEPTAEPVPVPPTPKPAAKASRTHLVEDEDDTAGLMVRRGPATD